MTIEGFATHGTFEGSLIGMDDLVSAQRTRETKTFTTCSTCKWLVTRVLGHSHVFSKSVTRFKDFSAVRAVVLCPIAGLFNKRFPRGTFCFRGRPR